MELARIELKSLLSIGEGVIPVPTSKSRVSWILSCFGPSEEGFEGKIYPFLGVLKNLRKHFVEFRHFLFPSRKLVMDFVLGN